LKGFSLTETTLGLVRHGQTDWNIDLRLQGSSDIPLNQTGIDQAKSASLKLKVGDWDVILVSPLSRARDTAEVFANRLGLRVVIVPELVERSFGTAEGLSHPEWRKLYESGTKIEGLESLEDLRIRANILLDMVANEYAGQKVLAVSHGAYIRKLLTIVSNDLYPTEGDRLANVSMNRLGHQDGIWDVLDYNPSSLAD
jgi:broad specificity phosphatase PhoE